MEAQSGAWVLSRLWDAATLRGAQLRVQLPPTVLFSNGVPSRWLDFRHPVLVGVAFGDQRSDCDAEGGGGLAAALRHSEAALGDSVRARVLEFTRRALEFQACGGAAAGVLSVAYNDGRLASVPVHEFIALCEHGEWRDTVASAQAGAPASSAVAVGAFVRGAPAVRHTSTAAAPSDDALRLVTRDFSAALAAALVHGGEAAAAAAGAAAAAASSAPLRTAAAVAP